MGWRVVIVENEETRPSKIGRSGYVVIIVGLFVSDILRKETVTVSVFASEATAANQKFKGATSPTRVILAEFPFSFRFRAVQSE